MPPASRPASVPATSEDTDEGPALLAPRLRPDRGRPRRAGGAAERPGHGGRAARRPRRGTRRHRRGEVLATALTPTRQDQLVDVDAGDGEACRSLRTFTWRPATSFRWPPWARSCRAAWPSHGRKMRGELVQRHVVLGERVGLGSDHGGNPHPPPAWPWCAVRRAMGITSTSSTTSRSPNRPDSMSVARVARDRLRLGVPFALPTSAVDEVGAERVGSVRHRGRGARPVRAVTARVLRDVSVGPSEPPSRAGSAWGPANRSTRWSTCRTT